MQTLGDLLECFQLYALCADCSRMERVDIAMVVERLGADLLVADFRQRLRCRKCQQRTGDMRIVYVGRQARVSGFHYRA